MQAFDWNRIKEDHEMAYARGQIAADMPAGMYSIEELEKISLDMDLSTVEVDTAMRMEFQSMPPEAQQKMLELLEKADPDNMDFWRKTLL